MNNKIVFTFVLLWVCFNVFSQTTNDSLTIRVQFQFEGAAVQLDSTYVSKLNDTLKFDKIKMYFSSPQLIYKNESNEVLQNSYYLIDIEDVKSQEFLINKTSFKEIIGLKFNIGIDSLASVSGALHGALDATNGMYWAWQSGFINFKIEGKSSSCLTRKNKFQFHIGGYIQPYYAMKSVEIQINQHQILENSIKVTVELSKLFDKIQLSQTNSIMIPGKDAMMIADLAKDIFSIE